MRQLKRSCHFITSLVMCQGFLVNFKKKNSHSKAALKVRQSFLF